MSKYHSDRKCFYVFPFLCLALFLAQRAGAGADTVSSYPLVDEQITVTIDDTDYVVYRDNKNKDLFWTNGLLMSTDDATLFVYTQGSGGAVNAPVYLGLPAGTAGKITEKLIPYSQRAQLKLIAYESHGEVVLALEDEAGSLAIALPLSPAMRSFIFTPLSDKLIDYVNTFPSLALSTTYTYKVAMGSCTEIKGRVNLNKAAPIVEKYLANIKNSVKPVLDFKNYGLKVETFKPVKIDPDGMKIIATPRPKPKLTKSLTPVLLDKKVYKIDKQVFISRQFQAVSAVKRELLKAAAEYYGLYANDFRIKGFFVEREDTETGIQADMGKVRSLIVREIAEVFEKYLLNTNVNVRRGSVSSYYNINKIDSLSVKKGNYFSKGKSKPMKAVTGKTPAIPNKKELPGAEPVVEISIRGGDSQNGYTDKTWLECVNIDLRNVQPVEAGLKTIEVMNNVAADWWMGVTSGDNVFRLGEVALTLSDYRFTDAEAPARRVYTLKNAGTSASPDIRGFWDGDESKTILGSMAAVAFGDYSLKYTFIKQNGNVPVVLDRAGTRPARDASAVFIEIDEELDGQLSRQP